MSETASNALRDLLRTFVDAPTWAASHAIVTEHQAVLLTDVADSEFARWIAEEPPTTTGQHHQTLCWYRDVLQRCRAAGIDATFADLPAQRPLNKALQAFLALNEPETLPAAFEDFPEMLSIPAIEAMQVAISEIAEVDSVLRSQNQRREGIQTLAQQITLLCEGNRLPDRRTEPKELADLIKRATKA